ncbi:MAG: hypothetical protein JOY68_03865 [Candidatus Dormibacteraeota bacterium]|nr:hypothetical protein [Candidatus Dormibacteraeota bacterium]
MSIGGVTVFALPPDLALYIDTAVLRRPWVIVGGGSRSLKLRLAGGDLLRIPGAEEVDGLSV